MNPEMPTFAHCFADLPDPRKAEQCDHLLIDILFIAVCAVICGADGFTDMEEFGLAKQVWLRKNRLMLGQVKVAEDSNEITAVPPLLRLLTLKGCIVTVDAMHCQKLTVEEIRRQEADYVVALKQNQEHLYDAVEAFFEDVCEERTHFFEIDRHQSVDGEHGRIEERRYWQVNVAEDLAGKAEWADLRSLGMYEARREVKGKTSVEKRY
jgi:predicted transposase YbfD/YdcC